MNVHTKRKWVKALRSGDYTQGTNALVRREPVGFEGEDMEVQCCCLGVLLMETTPEFCTLEHAPPYEDGQFGVRVGVGSTATATIPNDLATMYGLGEDVQEVLAEMNDNGTKFPAIADWIEKTL